MAENQQIQAKLSAEAKEQIIRRIDEIRTYLPFIVSLNNDERMSMRKMGEKSMGYVLDRERAARMFPEVIPPTLNIEEMRENISLRNELAEIKGLLSTLMTGIDNTMMAAGSDAMITADLIYGYFKTMSAQGARYKSVTSEIGKRFKR